MFRQLARVNRGFFCLSRNSLVLSKRGINFPTLDAKPVVEIQAINILDCNVILAILESAAPPSQFWTQDDVQRLNNIRDLLKIIHLRVFPFGSVESQMVNHRKAIEREFATLAIVRAQDIAPRFDFTKLQALNIPNVDRVTRCQTFSALNRLVPGWMQQSSDTFFSPIPNINTISNGNKHNFESVASIFLSRSKFTARHAAGRHACTTYESIARFYEQNFNIFAWRIGAGTVAEILVGSNAPNFQGYRDLNLAPELRVLLNMAFSNEFRSKEISRFLKFIHPLLLNYRREFDTQNPIGPGAAQNFRSC